MHLLSLTLDTLAENLALDEALVEAADAGELPGNLLRLWEISQEGVVLGRSSVAEVEVNLEACRRAQVPVLRRTSGGGTVLAGKGCLMYAVVLDFATYPQLRMVDQAHRYVLDHMARMLLPHLPEVTHAGTSDLALESAAAALAQKFSGNAIRKKRDHLLYHGTLLYDFDISRIAQLLATAVRTPEYRQERTHEQFVTNLPLTREVLVNALVEGWRATEVVTDWPVRRVGEILKAKYQDNPEWVIYPGERILGQRPASP